MLSEALQTRLEQLTWDQRRALHFLATAANDENYVLHPDGRSVAILVAHALDCHQSTGYEVVTSLEGHGLLTIEPHPMRARHRRNHGYCVYLSLEREVLRSDLAQAILQFPPRAERWLGYAPVQRVLARETCQA